MSKFLSSQISLVSGKVPLRVVLVVPFVLQIFAAVGIVGYLSFRNGVQSVNNVASQLRNEITHRIEQNLRTYLSIPHQINQTNANAIRLGLLNVQFLKSWELHMWEQLQLFKSVGAFGIGNEQGEAVAVQRNPDGKVVIRIVNNSTNFNLYTYRANEKGSRAALLDITKNFNLKVRPWYNVPLQAGKPSWSQIYTQVTFPTLQISAGQPVYDRAGKLLGVASTSLYLSEVSDFLQTIKIGKNGQTFIVERDGMLVATSTGELPFTVKDNKQERLPATASRNALTRATAKYLTERFGSLNRLSVEQQLEFYFHGDRQLLQILPLQDDKGLNWLIVVAVPESDFMEQIDANTRATVLLCFAALGIATLIGIATSKYVVQPILNLKEAATALSEGQFNRTVPVERSDEIGVLASAFNSMARQLQESFEQLENRVQERTAELQKSERREREKALQLADTLQELKLAQSMIIQAEKMSSLGQMVAGVAHEINNPVNFIHGNLSYTSEYAENLLRLVQLYQQHYPNPLPEIEAELEAIDLEFLAEDLPKTLASMKVGTERIRQIVLSLRNFSRLDEAEKKAVDLHEGIESTLLILQNRLKATVEHPSLEVVKKYGNLPPVECYAGQLNQVFMNIIANAIDAIEDAFAKRKFPDPYLIPTIEIATTVKENNWIEIRISDSGVGMPEEVRQKIFDPFYTTKPVGKGTGLGLSISYQIVVEKHGGRLECTSELGKGTTFAIAIPAKQQK